MLLKEHILMLKNKYNLRFIYLLLPLYLLEIIFHLVQFNNLDLYFIFKSFLFVFIISVIISLLVSNTDNLYKYVYFIIILTILPDYAIIIQTLLWRNRQTQET